MSRSKGKRYDGNQKLNWKKVFGVLIAIAVLVMFFLSIKFLLKKSADKPKEQTQTKIGYATILKDNKWGVIDSNGNTVIEPTYEEMIVIPDTNKPIFICSYDINYENGTYKTRVINDKSENLFTDYEEVVAIDNSDGANTWYEKNVLKVKKNGKYGLINLDGKEILGCKYDRIDSLKGVTNSLIVQRDSQIGLVNNSGETMINEEYKEIKAIGDQYENGYIIINKENQYGITDANKHVIIEPRYEDIKPVTGNDMYVVKESGKWKVVNKKLDTVMDFNYDDIKEINGENLIVKKGNNYGVVNTKGEQKIPTEYQNLTYAFSDYYIAEKDHKYGIIKLSGEIAIDFNYTNMVYIKEADLFEGEKENLTTDMIDRELNIKLTGIVSELNTDKGYIRMRINEDYQYYNFKFEEKKNTEILSGNTLFLSKQNGKYGFVDKEGNVIVNYEYDDATEQNGYGYAAVKKNGKWGSINKNGEIIAETNYNLDQNLVVDFIGKWHLAEDLSLNYYTDN